MLCLVIKKGREERHSFPLTQNVVSIGSHTANDIQLDEPSQTISRFHAALFKDNNGNYHLQDLGSKNVALINGQCAPYKILQIGDEISVGEEFTLSFQDVKGLKDAGKKPRPVRIISENKAVKSHITRLRPPSSYIDYISILEKEPHKLSLLYRLNRELHNATALEDALKNVLEKVLEATGAERGFIARGSNVEELDFLAMHPNELGTLKSRTMINQVLLEGEALLSRDAVSDTCFKSVKSVLETGIRSALGIPLIENFGVIGLLYLYSINRPGLFSEDDMMLHTLLGGDIALAMKKEEEQVELNLTLALGNEIVGISRPIKELMRAIEKVAPYPASVLITGETGTGKELVAKAIHKASGRKGRFVEFNCAAVPETLVESELFGYRKGSHATAFKDKKGLFEIASGGTLFLDEIGNMTLTTQAKILKAIDENVIWSLGATEPLKVDTRIIAATNKDLLEAIKKEDFRDDLYQRFKIVEIYVPPLRKRKDDIPLLAGYFICRFRNRFNKDIGALSRDALDLLRDYPWPGNVRELSNIMERAAIYAGRSANITPGLLKKGLQDSRSELKTLENVEREHIISVLEQTRGNKENPWHLQADTL